MKCHYCDGEGIVEFDLGYAGHSEATEPMIDIRPCPNCNGSGKVEPPPCPRCGGDGEIYYTEWCGGVGYPVVDKCPVCFGISAAPTVRPEDFDSNEASEVESHVR